MANPADDSLRNLLGLNNDSTGSKIATFGLGGLVGGTIAFQWLQNQGADNSLNRIFGIRSASSIEKEATRNVAATTSEFNKDLEKIGTDVTEGIKAQEASQKAQIADSAKARGFTAEVANASQQQYGGSLSGAYATAAKALAQAKAGATATMGGVMSRYYQNLAEQQFNDLVQKRAERAGILGQIGGISGAILKQAMTPSAGPTQAEREAATPQVIREKETLDIEKQALANAESMADKFSSQGLNPIQIPQRRIS